MRSYQEGNDSNYPSDLYLVWKYFYIFLSSFLLAFSLFLSPPPSSARLLVQSTNGCRSYPKDRQDNHVGQSELFNGAFSWEISSVTLTSNLASEEFNEAIEIFRLGRRRRPPPIETFKHYMNYTRPICSSRDN